LEKVKEENMDIFLSSLTIGVSFLLVYIVLPFLKVHLGKKEIAFARDIITDIVASLEKETISGSEKKKLAIALVKKILEMKKIHIPDMLLSTLIESSLYFLRKSFPKKREKRLPEEGILGTYSVKAGE